MSEVSARHRELVSFIKQRYRHDGGFIPLHAPRFDGHEKKYLMQCIDSTFVSSVGEFVNEFEAKMCAVTGSNYAIATVNGTAALHMALILAGVSDGDEVITQPLTFVATCNAISYLRAHPVFVDVDRDSLGLSPVALNDFLNEYGQIREDGCFNKLTGRRISAVVPMHTFGLPARIEALVEVCARWGIPLIEDAAESLGSYVGDRHTGTFGLLGIFSFNGNKIVTCGGGGCIVTNDEHLGKQAKYLTTTAKRAHAWEFFHDQVGYNYRMPNLNAALACAQLEQLSAFVENKRETASAYFDFCARHDIPVVAELQGCRANYWLTAILMDSGDERDAFLEYSNAQGVMTRPAWTLMNELPAFSRAQHGPLDNSLWLKERLVNIPSSVTPVCHG